MSEELKACPMCGCKAEESEFAAPENYGFYYIGCTNCGLMLRDGDAEQWNRRHIPEGFALVPVESLERAAEWFTESQGWNWLEYDDKPLDICEMRKCVDELKKFKAMTAAVQPATEEVE